MNNEHEFYRELSVVPDLPPDLYTRINEQIKRRTRVLRSLIGLAATLIFAAGLFGILTRQQPKSPFANTTLQPEITAELQQVHDYLNAGDLEDDLAFYTVFSDY